MDNSTLPDWLRPTDDQISEQDMKFPRTKDHKEIQRITFESIFERVIESLEAGRPASQTIKEDPRGVDVGRFMAWVRRDAQRFDRFQEAKKNGMLILEDRLMETVDDTESMEDVQRTKLRVDTIKFVLQSWDRRYKSNEKAESNNGGPINITITGVTSPYNQIESGVTVDG